jgi:hypothetical protein
LTRTPIPFRPSLFVASLLLLLLGTTGCQSHWVNATIENRSGHPVRELEVDYPSASFGTNALADTADMHYRFSIRGNGPAKVEFTTQDGKTIHAQGLALSEGQQGRLLIRLLPLGKVEFVTNFDPAS